MTKIRFLGIAFWVSMFALPVRAQDPQWIWHDNQGASIKTNEVRFFRKVFQVERKPLKAVLSVAADDDAKVYLYGKEISHAQGYDKPNYEDLTDDIKQGQNVLAVRGLNTVGDQAGLLVRLELSVANNRSEFVVSDPSWLSSDKEQKEWQNLEFKASGWTSAVSRGKLGDKPWGEVFKVHKATPAESLTVLPGFKVELLHSSEPWEGSWICMTTDSKGRLIISPQADSQPLLRLTLSRSGQVSQIEKIYAPVHQAMGL